MHVQYYTYGVEIQERGAGHINITWWLNLSRLELLTRSTNGDLKNWEEWNLEFVSTIQSQPSHWSKRENEP